MSIPTWTLLGFAAWTALLLTFTIGVYRWGLILTARARIAQFRADQVEGADWYKRAMRAHANCIENLPVFGAIVFALYVTGISGPVVDLLCIGVLCARVAQSMVHVILEQTDRIVAVRFMFFAVQLVAFLALAGIVATHAAGIT